MRVKEDDVRAIASVMAEFHAKAESAGGNYGSPELVWGQIADLGMHRETAEKASGLGRWVDGILGASEACIKRNAGLMRRRAAGGFVKDCHGDLHCANIFIDGGIRIIDCIEFSRDFRCIDVASDIAFMAMDLDYSGREGLSRAFVEEYVSKTGDTELETLLPLYKCYRANVRAKIAAIELGQGAGDESRVRMERYLLLASKYAKVL
jgi:aminoglycoside phosphotransferase family enzyme